MLTKVPYIKTYTMQGHPVQGLTVFYFVIFCHIAFGAYWVYGVLV